MARPDFRSQAAARLATERTDLSPAIFDLLSPAPDGSVTDLRKIATLHIEANPDQPRQHFDEASLEELAASIREHGVLQPVLVRPHGHGRFQLIAGERRWRASKIAGLTEIPAIVEDIDDDAAMEIAIIENLQREDISPLDEADMFARMITDHGYSLRRLAQKLGKDKGYVENRLRLADAPPEIRELVSVRRDTLSAAYELMKVPSPAKRRRLAAQVADGQLSLVKLRERIEGRPKAVPAEAGVRDATADEQAPTEQQAPTADVELVAMPIVAAPSETEERPLEVIDISAASEHLSKALAELTEALQTDTALAEASSYERQDFAKYLTIAKIRLENAIAVVRAEERSGVVGVTAGRPRDQV